MSSVSTAFIVHYNQKLAILGGGGERTMASGGDRRPCPFPSLPLSFPSPFPPPSPPLPPLRSRPP